MVTTASLTGLLDTSILVDVLRLTPVAQEWLSQQRRLGVPSAVWLEVLQGAGDSKKQKQALTLLQQFSRVDVISDDYAWAIQQVIQYRLNHNVSGVDSLIAAVSFRLQLPLHTGNLKHFAPLLGNLAQKPY